MRKNGRVGGRRRLVGLRRTHSNVVLQARSRRRALAHMPNHSQEHFAEVSCVVLFFVLLLCGAEMQQYSTTSNYLYV